jgi:hypothetical protein
VEASTAPTEDGGEGHPSWEQGGAASVEKGPPAAVECGRIRDGLRRSPNATMDGSEERGGGWRCRSSFWNRSMRKEGMR